MAEDTTQWWTEWNARPEVMAQRVNFVGVHSGQHTDLDNATFKVPGGDLVVVYYRDSKDNTGEPGKAGTTRRVCNEDLPPLREMKLKAKYLNR